MYFTINSLLLFKVLLDGGNSKAIISLVASRKNDNEVFIINEFSKKRFRFFSILGFLLLTPLGYFIFKDRMDINGIFYLITLTSIFSLSVLLIPKIAIIEGLGQLKNLYFYKIISATICYLLSWLVLILGYGLLNVIILNVTSLFVTIIFLNYMKNKNHISDDKNIKVDEFSNNKLSEKFKKFAGKISLTFWCNFTMMNGIVPFTYSFIGASVAGQLGLTSSLFSAIRTLSSQFIIVKRPSMGSLYSKGEVVRMTKVFFNAFGKSIAIFLLIFIVATIMIKYLNVFDLNKKLLNNNNYFLYFAYLFLVTLSSWFAFMFRSRNKEIFNVPSLLVLTSVIFTVLYFVNYNNVELMKLLIILIFCEVAFTFSVLSHHLIKLFKEYKISKI